MATEETPSARETLGRYQLEERIASGPLGEVFRAKRFGVEGFEKSLLVKRIHPELCRSARFVELLVQQAKLVLRLSHANVVQVLDVGRAERPDGPVYFLATELVLGVDLRKVIARARRAGEPIDVALAVHLASEVAKGLDHAHRRRDDQLRPLGVLHRSLRPSNVLVSFEGEVKLSDFAIATARGPLVETRDEARAARLHDVYAYMSPEQIAGDPIDARSDLFSLGAVLYELLAGAHPFRAATAIETVARVREASHAPLASVRPDVPEPLAALVARLLARDADARPEDAATLHEELLGLSYASATRAGPAELAASVAPLRDGAAPDSAPLSGPPLDEEPPPSFRRPSVPPSFRRISSIPQTRGAPAEPPSTSGAQVELAPSSGRAASDFVGRTRELRRFGELMALATRKRLQAVTLAGPSGIGKSRLLREVGLRLRRGEAPPGFHLVGCVEDDRDRPLAAAAAMLASLAGGASDGWDERLRALGLRDAELDAARAVLTPGGTAAASPPAVRGALVRAIASLAEERLQLVAWDDAHVMDRESKELIEGVIAALASARVVLVAIVPDGSAPIAPGRGRHRVELGPLEPAEVERLTALACGVHVAPRELVAYCRARGRGHPGLVETMVAELIEQGAIVRAADGSLEADLAGADLPSDLVALLASRTSRLSDGRRALLAAAAILGERFPTAPLASMLRARPDDVAHRVDELTELGWLERAGPAVAAFPSAAVRAAVLSRLGADVQARIHAAAATALETALMVGDGADDQAVRVARHWIAAGDPARAAGSLAASARHHLAARRYARAVDDAGRALALVDVATRPAADLAAWIALLAVAAEHAPLGHDAAVALDAAATALERAEPDVRLAAHVDAAIVLGASDRFDRASKHLQAAQRLARGRAEGEAKVLAVEADLYRRRGDFKRAREAYDRLRRAEIADPKQRRRALLGLAQAHAASGEHAPAAAALDRAAELGTEGDADAHEIAHWRAQIAYLTGDFAGAAALAEQAITLARSLGEAHAAALDLVLLGRALVRTGELPRAYATLQRALEVADGSGDERAATQARAGLAYLDAVNGARDAERGLVDAVSTAAARGWRWDELDGRWLLAQLAIGRGDTNGARKLLERCRDLGRASGYRLVTDDSERALLRL